MGRFTVGPRRDVGHEPDYRFSLANERTFLAWIRTSLALMAGGLALFQALEDLAPTTRKMLGVALVVLGTVLTIASFARWICNEDALRADAPLPPTRLPLVLAGGVVTVAVVAIAILTVTTPA